MSDRSGIEFFEPRDVASGDRRELVWAVDAAHLVNYLLPRDCPRVCFRPSPNTSAADLERFFPAGPSAVVVIEAAWLPRATAEPLWVYSFAASGFVSEDVNAGYFVSESPVIPSGIREIPNPVAELVRCGAELRVVSRLHQLAEAVVQSSVSFSCIRMRNALP